MRNSPFGTSGIQLLLEVGGVTSRRFTNKEDSHREWLGNNFELIFRNDVQAQETGLERARKGMKEGGVILYK